MPAISAHRPTGLRWRLAAWVALVMLVSAVAIFAVVYVDTGSELRGQIERDIAGDTSELAQALSALSGQTPAQITAAAHRYVQAQPHTATSTLLFVLVPGQATVSNHPEVFGVASPDDGETASAQRGEDAAGRRLLVARLGYSTALIPDLGHTRIHERAIRVGSTPVIVAAGEPLYTVERAQHSVARAFVLAGAVLLALALIASYVAGARVSAPLRRMATFAARVDAGDLAPRMDMPASRPDELRILGEAFNHMLDRLAEAFRSQREFIADASHELRTPLTVMRGQLEVLAAQVHLDEPEVRRVEALVQAEISRMSRLVDDLLVLATTEQTDFLRFGPIDLRGFVTHLWEGVTLIADRRFELGPVPEGTLHADPDRLAQALRNLLRNAVEHTADATGLVALEVEPVGDDKVRFAVIDDGPGVPPQERERVFERFHRTDAARNRSAGGAGLGLAIVRAVADAHGGHVRAIETGGWHGARLELVLPGFEPRGVPVRDVVGAQPPLRA